MSADGGNDSFTKLLLHFNEANGVTTFIDSSASARTITTVGNVVASNAQAKFGSTSCLFDGASDYLTAPNSSDFEFGSGPFTVDWWEYRTATTNSCPAIARDGAGLAGVTPWYFGWSDGTSLVAYGQTSATWDLLSAVAMGTITLNTWVHYAVSRDATNIYTFQDGVQKSVTATTAAFMSSSGDLTLGRSQAAANTFPGHQQEMRVSKGICRWVGGTNGVTYFTPPTAPYF